MAYPGLYSMGRTSGFGPSKGNGDSARMKAGETRGPRIVAVGRPGAKTWDKVKFTGPYSSEAVNMIKSIPWKHREWKKPEEAWYIDRDYLIDLYLMFPMAVVNPPVAREVRKYLHTLRPQVKEPTWLKGKKIPGLKNAKLRPYQAAAVEWLLQHDHNFLTDDMGLGKTMIALAYALAKARVDKVDPYSQTGVMVVPNTAKFSVWADHLTDFTDYSFAVIDGSASKRKQQFQQEVNWYIINYEACRLHTEELQAFCWDYIIVDEFHRLRNPDAQQTKAVTGMEAEHILNMSGTPIVGKLQESQPAMHWVGLTDLSYEDFTEEFCVRTQTRYGDKVVGFKNLMPEQGYNDNKGQKLLPLLLDNSLRREKSEVLEDLPEKTYQRVEVDMTPGQKKMYNELVDQCILDIGNGRVKTIADLRVRTMRLLQVCENPANIEIKVPMPTGKGDRMKMVGTGEFGPDTSGKMDEVLRALKEDGFFENGEKVCIFSAYRRSLDLMRQRTDPFWNSVMVRGGIPAKVRRDLIVQFQNDPETQIYYGTLEANKEAVTLTAAPNMILLGKSWNPGDNDQVEDRIVRQDKIMEERIKRTGGDFSLNIISVTIKNSIENWFLAKILGKHSVAALGRGDEDAVITDQDLLMGFAGALKKL